jgi:hypothetical protein
VTGEAAVSAAIVAAVIATVAKAIRVIGCPVAVGGVG